MRAKQENPDQLSLFDFFPADTTIPEIVKQVKKGKKKTAGIEALLEKAQAYQEQRMDAVPMREPEYIQHQVLPRYGNLCPVSDDEAVILFADTKLNLNGVRHIHAEDLTANEMVAKFVRQLSNRKSEHFFLVYPMGVKRKSRTFYQAVERAKDIVTNRSYGIGMRCLDTFYHDTHCVREQTQDWQDASFTYPEEQAIKKYWFDSVIGKPLKPSKGEQTLFDSSKETLDTIERLRQGMQYLSHEELCCATIDKRHRITGVHVMTTGTISSSLTYMPLFMELSAQPDVKDVLVFHNHPSGDPAPSREDYAVASRCSMALSEIGKHAYSLTMGKRGCVDFTPSLSRATERFTDRSMRFTPRLLCGQKEKAASR